MYEPKPSDVINPVFTREDLYWFCNVGPDHHYPELGKMTICYDEKKINRLLGDRTEVTMSEILEDYRISLTDKEYWISIYITFLQGKCGDHVTPFHKCLYDSCIIGSYKTRPWDTLFVPQLKKIIQCIKEIS